MPFSEQSSTELERELFRTGQRIESVVALVPRPGFQVEYGLYSASSSHPLGLAAWEDIVRDNEHSNPSPSPGSNREQRYHRGTHTLRALAPNPSKPVKAPLYQLCATSNERTIHALSSNRELDVGLCRAIASFPCRTNLVPK